MASDLIFPAFVNVVLLDMPGPIKDIFQKRPVYRFIIVMNVAFAWTRSWENALVVVIGYLMLETLLLRHYYLQVSQEDLKGTS